MHASRPRAGPMIFSPRGMVLFPTCLTEHDIPFQDPFVLSPLIHFRPYYKSVWAGGSGLDLRGYDDGMRNCLLAIGSR